MRMNRRCHPLWAASSIAMALGATAHAGNIRGDRVTLPTLKVTASLVGGKKFKVSATADEDQLVRKSTPPMTLRFSVEAGTTCQLWFWRNRDLGKHVDRPPYAPGGYQQRAIDWSNGSSISLCADIPDGILEANLAYKASWSSPEAKSVLPFLEEVARAVASRPPAKTVAMTLPVAGLPVALPMSAGVAWRAERSPEGFDRLVRVRPADGPLVVAVKLVPRKPPLNDCLEANLAFARSNRGTDQWSGKWLPRSYAARVVSAKGGRLQFACADVPAGLLTVEISHTGPIERSSAGLSPLLGALAIAASRAPAPAAAFAPATTTEKDVLGQSAALLHLPVLGVSVAPMGTGVQVRSSAGGDELFQTVPNPLIIRLNTYQGNCDLWFGRYPRTSRVDRPRYLPSQFYPSATETKSADLRRAELCADVPTGVVWATILHRGELASPEVLRIAPLLDAVVSAVRAHPQPVRNLLPVSGLRVALPGGQRVLWEIGRGRVDRLDYLRYMSSLPGGNQLGITVEVKGQAGQTCANEMGARAAKPHFQSRIMGSASWLPPNYHPQWVHQVQQGTGTQYAWVCTSAAGKLLTLTIFFSRVLDEHAAAALLPLLRALAQGLQG
jgi:hypothetical protein